jgi:hypothetical protein
MTSDSAEGQQPPVQPGAVLVRTFSNLDSADVAAANLKAHGIQCWLQGDDCGGMLAAMDCVRGVKLVVRPEDLAAAMALLAAAPVADTSVPEPAKVTDRAQSRGESWFVNLALGAVLGVVGCLFYQSASQLGTKTFPYDTNGDHKPDERIVMRNGYTIEQSFDRNFDGTLDSWYYYDSKARRKLSRADDNFDGRADFTWYYTNGLLARADQDTDFNGTPDVTYFYQDDLTIRAEWRPNGTNVMSLKQTFRNGILVEETRDVDGDGQLDISIQYDAFQNPVATNSLRPHSAPPR